MVTGTCRLHPRSWGTQGRRGKRFERRLEASPTKRKGELLCSTSDCASDDSNSGGHISNPRHKKISERDARRSRALRLEAQAKKVAKMMQEIDDARDKAVAKEAQRRERAMDRIHNDIGIHKSNIDSVMNHARFRELPQSLVECVQVFCILSRRFVFTIRVYFFTFHDPTLLFLRFGYTHRAVWSLAMARTSRGGGLGPTTAQTRAQTSVGTSVE